MTPMMQRILEAVAGNLNDFGYPDARYDNITSTRVFAMFAESQVADFGLKHRLDPEVKAACDAILEAIKTTVEGSIA